MTTRLQDRKIRQGFTLVELLVVMVIIAIASSIVVLKVGTYYSSNKRTEIFARELSSMIQLARNQAVFSLNVIGLRISGNKVTFLQLNNTNGLHWIPLDEHDSFWASRTIPEKVIMQLTTPDDSESQSSQKDASSPQIIIFPSGEMTPFTLSMHKLGSSQTYLIKGSYPGTIELSHTE